MDSDLARRQALEAEQLSASDPHRARLLADEARRWAIDSDDRLTLAVSERALGLAARELHELPLARRHLRRSISIAESAGLDTIAAESRVRLANVVSLAGSTSEARLQLQAIDETSTGVTRARSRVHEAILLLRMGELDEALQQFRRVIPTLRRLGLALDEAQVLTNRAIVQTYRGEYAAAEADLRRAEALAPLAGEGFAAAKVHHNLGFVAACRGDVPEALTRYDEAQAEFADLGQSQAPVLSDRAEALLSVGLADEGLEAASRAVAELEQLGADALDLAEARLMEARALLLAGMHREAATSARNARGAFRRQGRRGWGALADYVIARAGLTRRIPPVEALDEVASELEAGGWLLPALELRLAWAIRASRREDERSAREQLRLVSRHRVRGPAQVRAYGWHAEALLRLGEGDRSGCQSALRAGLRILDEHHAVLGATELRVHASSRSEQLATLGCRLAIEDGRPERVLEWAERWRAGSLHLQPVRPPADDQLETMLEQLRHVTMAMQRAALESEPTDALRRRQAVLESAIRDRSRHARGGRYGGSPTPPSGAALQRLLGNRALVEYVVLDGRLYAVTVTPRRLNLFRLGSVREVVAEIDSLRFSYARLARGRGSEATMQAFASAAAHAASVLERRLLDPLREELGDRSLVIVPTGRLHHLPWGGLPRCATKTVSVAPSATLWAEAAAHADTSGDGRIVLVAGPGMEHAEEEVVQLAELYPAAVTLVREDATTQRVAESIDGAEIAHLAAHGSFRSDNALFSSLQLFDGELTVYNFERLSASPRLVVLSACESGLSDVHPGDELLGLSAAVLSLGTVNLMASVVAVPDVTTAALMVEVHRRLLGGESPAASLALAREALDESGRADFVSTAGFVCFGA